MRALLILMFLTLSFSLCLAEDPNPVKESTVGDRKNSDEVNDGTIQRDAPPQAISHPCPYTCNDAGYSRSQCREWQDGNTCMIGPKLDSPQSDNE